MQILGTFSAFFGRYDPSFYLSLFAGTIVIVLFAMKKLAEPSEAMEENSVERKFRLSELTDSATFIQCFLIYTGGLILLFLISCFLLPALDEGLVDGNLALKNLDSWAKSPLLPIGIAVAIAGLAPQIPILDAVEMKWREFTHKRAQLPKAIRQRVQALRASEFVSNDIEDVGSGLVGSPVNPTEEDLLLQPMTVRHRWARLSILLHKLRSLGQDPKAANFSPPDFTLRYASLVEQWIEERDGIAAELDIALRSRKFGDSSGNNQEFESEREIFIGSRERMIRDLLTNVYAYISCIMLQIKRKGQELEIESYFGFTTVDSKEVIEKSKRRDIIGYSFVITCFVGIVYAAFSSVLGKYTLGSNVPTGWPNNSTIYPFLVILNFYFPFGLALLTATRIKDQLIRSGRWFDAGELVPPFVSLSWMFTNVTLATLIAHAIARILLSGLNLNDLFSYPIQKLPIPIIYSISAIFISIMHTHLNRGMKMFALMAVLSTISMSTLFYISMISYYHWDYKLTLEKYPETENYIIGASLYELTQYAVVMVVFLISSWIISISQKRSSDKVAA